LALATGSHLHLIKPLGFSIDDKSVKRAGLDYWKDVTVTVWEDWETFLEQKKPEANTLTIPMVEGATRSLNLATAVSIVLYEGMRQIR